MIENERKFIHEVASPVAAALFIVESLVEESSDETTPLSRESLKTQLKTVFAALTKVTQILKDRRAVLIEGEK